MSRLESLEVDVVEHIASYINNLYNLQSLACTCHLIKILLSNRLLCLRNLVDHLNVTMNNADVITSWTKISPWRNRFLVPGRYLPYTNVQHMFPFGSNGSKPCFLKQQGKLQISLMNKMFLDQNDFFKCFQYIANANANVVVVKTLEIRLTTIDFVIDVTQALLLITTIKSDHVIIDARFFSGRDDERNVIVPLLHAVINKINPKRFEYFSSKGKDDDVLKRTLLLLKQECSVCALSFWRTSTVYDHFDALCAAKHDGVFPNLFSVYTYVGVDIKIPKWTRKRFTISPVGYFSFDDTDTADRVSRKVHAALKSCRLFGTKASYVDLKSYLYAG